MDWEKLKEPEWVFGGVLLLGLFVASRSSSTGDVDALTRMLIAETSFAHGEQEMAQIVYVALNRSRRRGLPVTTVVSPAAGTWNAGDLYRILYNNAPKHARWKAARAFVERVLGGAYDNAGYTSFIHPQSIATPPCYGERVEADTISGRRCIPRWSVGGTVVGRGMFV